MSDNKDQATQYEPGVLTLDERLAKIEKSLEILLADRKYHEGLWRGVALVGIAAGAVVSFLYHLLKLKP